MNEVKKKAIWDQWQQGHPMSVIARSVHKPPATVFSCLRYYGGIRPRPRTQRSSALRLEEREEISRGVASGLKLESNGQTIVPQSLDLQSRTGSQRRHGSISRH
jgi:hypothetical protein